MKKSLIFFVSILIFSQALLAQNEAKKWYFGNKAALDFLTNPPTTLPNSSMNVLEGCSSIADSTGALLFYTNGDTIWNKFHNVMANGTGLLGKKGSQTVASVKQPGSNSIYYVFTIDQDSGFRYSLVDITLASGMGSVTVKNYSVDASTQHYGKITIAKHCNAKDYWIVINMKMFNNFDFHQHHWFRSYLLSSTGLNTTAAISTFSSSQGVTQTNSAGCMKISSDGGKIALTDNDHQARSFYVGRFDNSNGIVSDLINFGWPWGYGCEFSPDGKKLYGTYYYAMYDLAQWDLTTWIDSTINNSRQVISTENVLGALQLGPNGKLYVARTGESYLGVVNSPNLSGALCSYTPFGWSLGSGTVGLGLPNFDNSIFGSGYYFSIISSDSLLCKGETAVLSTSSAVIYSWNGSPGSQTISVSPTLTTTYSVIATSTNGCAYRGAITLTVSDCTAIEEDLLENNHILIYPNPTKDFLEIKTIDFELSNRFDKLLIYSDVGRVVRETEFSTKLGTEDLPEGIYLLQLSGSSETVSKRFVITR